jgi:hypothetical protein
MDGVQTASAHSIQLASILRAQYSSGKVALPVDGGLYARFRHVQGVPSQSQGGYSVSKLQMIDLMVERLVRLQGDGFTPPSSASERDRSQLFVDLAEQLHNAMERSGEVRERYSAGLAEPGMMLSLYA